ncbi:hypothetical protein GQ457_02G034820 [Hibiscus cannabinus]
MSGQFWVEELEKAKGETTTHNFYYSVGTRDVKSGIRLGFRSGHFRSSRVRFRSGPFQVGFISGRVRSRLGYFRLGPKQIIDRLIRARVDFRLGSFQVWFISGRFHFRSGPFQFETLSLVQILDRRRRCLVGWVGIVHRWLLGHFE